MAFTDRDYLQGLVILDDRFTHDNIDATTSSFTEEGPEPDNAVPGSNKGFLQLEPLGPLDDVGDYDVQTVKEGAAVGGNQGGRYASKLSSASTYLGHLNFNKPTKHETILEATATYNNRKNPDSLTLAGSNGKILYAWAEDLLNPREIYVATRTVAGVHSSPVTVATIASATAIPTPALCQLPSGRVLLFYLDRVTYGGTTYSVLAFWYTDDEGATWTQGGHELAGWQKDVASVAVNKLRAVYHRGYITLIATHGTASKTYHLVSDDLGASFTEVEDFTDLYFCDALVDNAGRVVIVGHDAVGALKWSRKGSPFGLFADDPSHATTLDGVNVDVTTSGVGSPVCATLDDVGYLWVFWRADSANRGRLNARRADIDTMVLVKDRWNSDHLGGVFSPADTGDDDARFHHFDATVAGDSIALITTWLTPSFANPRGLSCVLLGGQSSLDWPRQSFGHKSGAPAYSSGFAWFPLDDPNNVSTWTMTNAGTNSYTTTSSGGQIQTTAGSRMYQRDGTLGSPAIHMFACKVASGGSLTAPIVGAELFWDTTGAGATGSRVEVRMTSTQIELWDTATVATQIGSTINVDMTAGREFLVYMVEGEILFAHRAVGGDAWTVDITSTSLNKAALGLMRIIWGHAAVGTGDSTWTHCMSAMDGETHDPEIIDQNTTGVTALEGREYSPFRQWIGSTGMHLRAKGSSSYREDTFTAPTTARFPIQRIDPTRSPSPSSKHHTTDTAAAVEVVWTPNGGNNSRILSSSLGLFLVGNFRTATLFGGDGATWDTLASIDRADGLDPATGSLNYQINGNHIRPATGSNPSRQFLGVDALDYVELAWSGGSATSPGRFRVLNNSAGLWADAGRRVEALLEDNDDADLATGVGTPTSCVLYAGSSLTVIHNVTTEYSHYRLHIPAQDTPEGKIHVGLALLGAFVPFGLPYDWARILGTTPNASSSRDRAGTRRVVEEGRPRRSVEVSWPQGWDLSQISGVVSSTPDHIGAHSSSPEGIGVKHDATLVERLLYRLKSGEIPVVYCPRVDNATGATVEAKTYTSIEEHLYGLVTSRSVRQTLLGDEFANELVSLNALVVEEQV